MENTSGRGKETVVPEDIGRWNWGAFLLAPLWGLFNRTFRALLVLVPVVGFFWWFVVGYKANEWAWRHKPWHSYEDFRRVQRLWSRWGVGITIGSIVILIATAIWAYYEYEKVREELVETAVARVASHREAAQALGTPVVLGDLAAFEGDVKVEGSEGTADFRMPVRGAKTTGKISVEAVKALGVWEFRRLELELSGSAERINLLARTPPPPKPTPPKPESPPPEPEPKPEAELEVQPEQTALPPSVEDATPAQSAEHAETPAPRQRRVSPSADARHCLVFGTAHEVARCAEAYR